jgi:hypothetical protein
MDPNSPLVMRAKSLAANAVIRAIGVLGLIAAVVVAILLLTTTQTPPVIAALTLIILAILLAIYLLASGSGDRGVAPGGPPETVVADFATEGVIVRVPWQGYKVRVAKLPLGTLDEVRLKQEDFQPGRLVINFQVENVATGGMMQKFKTPVELRVKYTPEDVERAKKAGKPLELAYWFNNRWIRFAQKHQFKLGDGFGVAFIADWGDPKIGWGP